jgi:hypothetical protein
VSEVATEENLIGFTLNELESARAREFQEEHRERHGRSKAAIGGRFTFEINVSSIGNFVVIRCACGERRDLTDYGSL